MPIFETTTPTLHEIIQSASNGTYLVPDIQRQYVWTPDKIIMLIDTLLKGWPFSNLLLWDAGEITNKNELIPHRSFKRIISRVHDVREEYFLGADVPNTITMILDGQQRIQSLLLAFGSADTGLTLLDKDWYSSFSDDREHPYRGSAVNQRFCTAKLYLDPNKLISNQNITRRRNDYKLNRSIDWTQVFKWAIPSLNDVSQPTRPPGYPWPIEKLWEKQETEINLIRASRLWDAAAGFNQLDDIRKYEIVSQLLNDCRSMPQDEDRKQKLEDSLVGVLTLVGAIREQRIPCLKLLSQEMAGYRDNSREYSETIVNIFNRLNAAGVPLKEDEICSAWIRNRWDYLRGEDTSIRAENLYKKIKDSFKFIKLDDKDVVSIFNIIWATYGSANDEDSRIFTSADLLNGRTVNIMTEWIYKNISIVIRSISKTSAFLEDSGIKFNYHFKSKNAIFASIIYIYGLEELSDENLINAEINYFENKYKNILIKWLLISLLGGRWARNSDTDIRNLIQKTRETKSFNIESIDASFRKFIEDNRRVCQIYINDYDHGDQYSRARLVFYAWYLSIDKLKEVSSMDSPTLDHLIPKTKWINKLKELGINDESIENTIHEIGNLNELGRCDNSSKNEKSLSDWLQHNNEIRNSIRNEYLENLKENFYISNELSNPVIIDINFILFTSKKIRERTKLIKNDILKYLEII